MFERPTIYVHALNPILLDVIKCIGKD